MTRTVPEQLVHFLSDMYSVEEQALAQLVSAPKLAIDPGLEAAFREHHIETETQAELVRQQLEAHDGSPSVIKDAIMKLGGKGFLLFARVQPETPGRLVVHAYAYEAMEWAGYELLGRFAQQAGDPETLRVAETIAQEERRMMQRLEQGFDAAEKVSHTEVPPEDLPEHVKKHLAELHAFESQGVQLLEKSEKIGGSQVLQASYGRMLSVIEQHAERLEQRLTALEADPSTLKSGALSLGGINWALFFQAQSDTPAKLVAFVYAFLHLQIAGYELCKRTAVLCEELLADKRTMSSHLAELFGEAVVVTLNELAE